MSDGIPLVRVDWENTGHRMYKPIRGEIIPRSPIAAEVGLKMSKNRPDPLWMTIEDAKSRGVKIGEEDESAIEVKEEKVEKAKPKVRRKPRAKKDLTK